MQLRQPLSVESSHQNQDFALRVLAWFDQHGRKHLPWQQEVKAYRVWVSEIMLQQTQVSTVIPYFEAFMAQFPTVQALAAAPIDAVLHRWTGLGYYARARNLHRAAQRVCDEFNGEFPQDIEQLQALPGIGRSTAGAIASLAFGQRAAILDGNVKRVLARHFRIAGWPGRADTLKALWTQAEALTPKHRCDHYTQAMMDLGATLCTRSKPRCKECPLKTTCAGLEHGDFLDYPGRKPRKTLPTKRALFLIVRDASGRILLEQRPAMGLWGGLWTPPSVDLSATESSETAPESVVSPTNAPLPEQELLPLLNQHLASLGVDTPSPAASRIHHLKAFRHTFSHFHLQIMPVVIELAAVNEFELRVNDESTLCWYQADRAQEIGMPAPVVTLLKSVLRQ